MIYEILLKIIFTIIFVRYGTNLIDTVYCETLTSEVDDKPTEDPDNEINVVIIIVLIALLFIAVKGIPDELIVLEYPDDNN